MDFSCISGMEHGSTGILFYTTTPTTNKARTGEDLDKYTTKEKKDVGCK
jgi:hypothetical protein